MKILIADAVDKKVADLFLNAGFKCDYKAGISKTEIAEIISEYHGLVVRSTTQVTAELIEKAKNLRIVGRAGAGVDNIDVNACTKKGILVMNTPGGNTISTAEHTCALILSIARWVPSAFHDVKNGKWERKKWVGTELDGKVIGVIGLGKIGKEVCKRMQSFGMKTIGYDPFLSKEAAAELNIELFSVEEIYKRANFLTFHTPLSPETKYLLNVESLKLLQKGVKIVNCARGGIVEEKAVLEGIKQNIIGGYAADVLEIEPPTFSEEILKSERVIISPHLGASTDEAQEKVAVQIAEQMIDAFGEKDIKGAVNGLALQFTFDPDSKPYIELSEKLGLILGQIEKSSFESIEFCCAGKKPNKYAEIILSSALKGIFHEKTNEPVNYINARFFAEEQGIHVSELKLATSQFYSNSIQITVKYGSGITKTVVGSVFNETDGRLIQIDEYELELKLDGDLFIYENEDRPGMLAQVGAVLAGKNINIGSLVLGRKKLIKKAITVLTVDSEIKNEVLSEIVKINGIINAKFVRLNS